MQSDFQEILYERSRAKTRLCKSTHRYFTVQLLKMLTIKQRLTQVCQTFGGSAGELGGAGPAAVGGAAVAPAARGARAPQPDRGPAGAASPAPRARAPLPKGGPAPAAQPQRYPAVPGVGSSPSPVSGSRSVSLRPLAPVSGQGTPPSRRRP